MWSAAGNLALSHEKRLIKDLIDTYKEAGVTGRPVKNSSEPIVLKYGLGLVQILRLDEKNQVLTIRAWNRLVCVCVCVYINSNHKEKTTNYFSNYSVCICDTVYRCGLITCSAGMPATMVVLMRSEYLPRISGDLI